MSHQAYLEEPAGVVEWTIRIDDISGETAQGDE